MIAWEYKLTKSPEVDFGDVTTREALDKVRTERATWLNKLGDQGWELIKLDYGPDGAMHVVMKRGRTA